MTMTTEETVATMERSNAGPSLLQEIVLATRIQPADEAYSLTRKGVEALVGLLAESGTESVKVSKVVLDDMIAEIDRKLSLQVDEILHHPDFQRLESAWRSTGRTSGRTTG
jgi:type VI secretion system protein ImpC